MRRYRFSGLAFALTLAAAGSLVSQAASAADYLGTGQFTTNQINWCHIGDYAVQGQNAAAKWSAVTDFDIYSNCSSVKAWTTGLDYGNTGWAGMAYICNVGGGCLNLNANYSDCTARSNTFVLGTWSNAERQFNATHELGHCWSLAHRQTDGTSVMQQGKLSITEPNARDKELVNARY